jgi:hypothetical protein
MKQPLSLGSPFLCALAAGYDDGMEEEYYSITLSMRAIAGIAGAACVLPVVAIMFFAWIAGKRRKDS